MQVFGSAQPFALPGTLSGANISCLELPSLSAVTDANAKFVLDVPVGVNLTLTLTHPKATTTQAHTFTVPPGGVPAGPETEVRAACVVLGAWGVGGCCQKETTGHKSTDKCLQPDVSPQCPGFVRQLELEVHVTTTGP